MTKTMNYQLPQWGAEDPVRREDFNTAMESIDAGLHAAQTAAETAQGTASAAQSAADAVQDAYTPDNKPYVTGNYTGVGSSQVITIGFKPTIVIITGENYYSSAEINGAYMGIFPLNQISACISATDTGFYVHDLSTYPKLNEKNHTYAYIAFR